MPARGTMRTLRTMAAGSSRRARTAPSRRRRSSERCSKGSESRTSGCMPTLPRTGGTSSAGGAASAPDVSRGIPHVSLWTTGGKLRLAQGTVCGQGRSEETIAEFVERRLGREFLDYAINPVRRGGVRRQSRTAQRPRGVPEAVCARGEVWRPDQGNDPGGARAEKARGKGQGSREDVLVPQRDADVSPAARAVRSATGSGSNAGSRRFARLPDGRTSRCGAMTGREPGREVTADAVVVAVPAHVRRRRVAYVRCPARCSRCSLRHDLLSAGGGGLPRIRSCRNDQAPGRLRVPDPGDGEAQNPRDDLVVLALPGARARRARGADNVRRRIAPAGARRT